MSEDQNDDKTQSFIALTAGTKVKHYIIIEKIGSGGMGEVYLAEDNQLDRKVALKFLPSYLCQDEDFRARFTREAKAAAKLDHPNIVPVYEVGDFKERPFFAMGYIEGKSLKEVIKEDKLSINDAIQITMQICEGLQQAHEGGITHRDIKPGNIIIDKENRPRILDFGLATVSGEEKLTKTGSTLGTVGYMAPEQIEGKTVDRRADLFSLGVILYEMLTSRKPFEGDNDAAIVKAITDTNPEPVARFKSGVTGELQQIIDKALTKDPTLRYQHADGMMADLKRLKVETAPSKKSKFAPILISSLVVILIIAALVLKPWRFEISSTDEAVASSNLLAIMYFDNMVDPSDSLRLGEITTNLLITDLSDAEPLKVVSNQRLYDILNLLGKKGEKRIDQEIATQVAKKAKAKWMLQGSILRTEPNIILTTQLVEVNSGTSISSQKIEGHPDDDIFSLVDKLSSEIKNNLLLPEMSESTTDRSISEITTNSIQAYRHYIKGWNYLSNYEYRNAEIHFLKAIEYDSTFAMAYYCLSLGGMMERDPKEMTEKAVTYSDNVTKLEKLIIKSREVMYQEDDPNVHYKELASLKKIIEYDSTYKEAYLRLANLDEKAKDWGKAIGYYEKVIELDPMYTKVYNELAYAYLGNGDKEKSLWAVNKYIELAPNEANPYDTKGEIAGFNGQLDLAFESYKKALEINPEFPSKISLGHMYLFKGEYEKADSCYRVIASSGNKNYRSYARTCLSFSSVFKGKFEEAIKILDDGLAADKLQQYDRTHDLYKHETKAFIYLEMGDCEKALASIRYMFDRNAAICTYVLTKCGEIGEADSLMEDRKQYIEEVGAGHIDFYWRGKGFAFVGEQKGDSAVYYIEKQINYRKCSYREFALNFMLAYAYLLDDKLPEAIAEFEKTQTTYSYSPLYYPTLYIKGFYYLGQAYEKSNWNDKAIEQYEKFVDIWKDAQPPVPEVEDAKTRLANLKTQLQ